MGLALANHDSGLVNYPLKILLDVLNLLKTNTRIEIYTQKNPAMHYCEIN